MIICITITTTVLLFTLVSQNNCFYPLLCVLLELLPPLWNAHQILLILHLEGIKNNVALLYFIMNFVPPLFHFQVSVTVFTRVVFMAAVRVNISLSVSSASWNCCSSCLLCCWALTTPSCISWQCCRRCVVLLQVRRKIAFCKRLCTNSVFLFSIIIQQIQQAGFKVMFV